MADNIQVTEGSGKTVATDDISGVQHQQVKIEFGADGTATSVSSANPLPTYSLSTLVTAAHDYITVAYPDSVTETYTYKTGGSGGTTVATVTVVYTDATKDALSTITRS